MRPYAIMVVGVAGVGKTTFAEQLSKSLGIEFIDLPKYVREHRLYEDVEEGDMIIDLARVASSIGSEIGRRGAAAVASVYSFKPRGVEVKVAYLLRKRPDILLRELKRRGYTNRKIAENLEAELVDQPLIEAINRYGEDRVVQVDATGRDLKELAEEAARLLKAGDPRSLHVEVDWVSELERLGKLDEILSYISVHKTL